MVTFAAGLLLVAGALALWRSRDSYGAKRGLPPGSLGIVATVQSLIDPSFYARSSARYGPVFKASQFHRSVVCIADLPLALDFLEQHASSLREPRQLFGRRSPRHAVAFLTDERHPRFRAVLKTPLVSQIVEANRGALANTIQIELTNEAARSQGAAFDPRPMIERMADTTLYRAIFGLRPDDPRVATLRVALTAIGPHRPDLRVDGTVPLIEFIQSLGRDLRDNQSVVDQGSLLGAILREDSRCLQDATMLGNLALIVLVTRNNVRLTLFWVLKELLDHPGVVEDLRNAVDQKSAWNVVRETLRRHVSEFMNRETVAEVPIGRYRVPAGWLIRVCVREAHDNASVFSDPNDFRPVRFSEREYSRRQYLPESDGVNSVIGGELALMIATEFANIVAMRWDGHITADGAAERSGYRHWKHWEPSPRLRVKLSPRSPST